MKYKLNRGQLNDLLGLLEDLKEDTKNNEGPYFTTRTTIDDTISIVIDQMNIMAGHTLAEQKNPVVVNEPTGWIGQMLDEERDGI